ncbi:MAG: hypothetical protein ACI9LM_004394 [Alteromonadaceae bacterium]|jgi:hypothetical protein
MKKQLFFIFLFWLAGIATVSATGLQLSLKLPPQVGEYHNPYVAVWIEDTSGKSVRTLVLWREGSKWLKDIRRWWRKVGRKDESLVDAVTSATRAAGSYQLSFQAFDDDKKNLAAGDYILHIEVVRENGGRGIIKQKFTLNGTSQTFHLESNAEIEKSIFTIKEKQ